MAAPLGTPSNRVAPPLEADDDTFKRAVIERLRIGMPGSGYILSSACSVAPRVQPQRLETMTALAEEHGRYDIEDEASDSSNG